MDFAKWIDNFCPPLSGEKLGLKTYYNAKSFKAKSIKINNL